MHNAKLDQKYVNCHPYITAFLEQWWNWFWKKIKPLRLREERFLRSYWIFLTESKQITMPNKNIHINWKHSKTEESKMDIPCKWMWWHNQDFYVKLQLKQKFKRTFLLIWGRDMMVDWQTYFFCKIILYIVQRKIT